MPLNPDQLRAKAFIHRWWTSSKQHIILEGRAGTGKTYLTLDVLSSLYGCKPILTSPTNEATRQLERIIGETYPLKTTYAALGYGFNTSTKHNRLEKLREPLELDNHNLLVVDEVSMIGKELLESILDSGIRVLFIGHSSQLPVVQTNLSTFDDCESVVFRQKYPMYTLTTPVRNTGELYQYCNHLESLITAKKRIVRRDYSFPKDKLEQYILGEGRVEFATEQCKIIAWSNAMVDSMNKLIRKAIFGSQAEAPYVPSDKILLTKPVVYLGDLGTIPSSRIVRLRNKGTRLTSNSRFTVQNVNIRTVMGVECYVLHVVGEQDRAIIYIAKNKGQLTDLYNKHLHIAYGRKTPKAKAKAFAELHFIMSLFGEVKHSYAITVHRSQGVTIPKVIAYWGDIRRCSNVTLMYKLFYVACSRASEDLKVVG